MLVTDGAVDTYDAIFAKYNWPERKVVCQMRKTSHHITHIASSFSSGCCDRGKVRSARLNFPLHFFHNYLSPRPGILMENAPLRAGGPMPSCGCEWLVQTCVIRKQTADRTFLWKDSRGSIKIRQRKQFKKCGFWFCTYEKYSFYS